MQQSELIEIGILDKQTIENYKLYGVVNPTAKDIKIVECRAYNLKLKAEQRANKEKWQRIQEARAFNLALRFKQQQQREREQDIKLYELVKSNKDILSSVR
ncbi:MAG: hypothetical protein AABY22_31175 [Nanoarchaeota archaeon]